MHLRSGMLKQVARNRPLHLIGFARYGSGHLHLGTASLRLLFFLIFGTLLLGLKTFDSLRIANLSAGWAHLGMDDRLLDFCIQPAPIALLYEERMLRTFNQVAYR
jgi:hypothetical protein